MNNDQNGPAHPQDAQDNLRRALDGQYEFSIRSIFNRAHSLLKDQYWNLVGACAVLVGVVALLMSLLFSFYTSEELLNLSHSQQAIIDIVAILFLSPIITGLIMVSVRAVQGKKVQPLNVFSYLPLTLSVALAQLLISVLFQAGLALLVLPGVYVFIASSFTLPLIADRNLHILSALALSFRVVNRYLGKFFLLFAIFFALSLLCFITLGLALVWVMPLYYLTLGILYNDLFGKQRRSEAISVAVRQETRFDA